MNGKKARLIKKVFKDKALRRKAKKIYSRLPAPFREAALK